MKIIIVAKYHHYTPWNYYRWSALPSLDLVVAGPGQPYPTLSRALAEHGDARAVLVFTTGYFPDVQVARRKGMTVIYRALNTYVQAERHRRYAPGFDVILVPQYQAAIAWRQFHPRVYWFPYAAHPAIYRPYPEEEVYDVAFVGTMTGSLYARRRRLLARLKRRYRVLLREKTYLKEAARCYCRGRIVFNESLAMEVNMRLFEAMACRKFVLTSPVQTGLNRLFKPGREMDIYNEDNLEEKVGYYLKHTKERERIANNGYRRILRYHTYHHRWLLIMALVQGEEVEKGDYGFTPYP